MTFPADEDPVNFTTVVTPTEPEDTGSGNSQALAAGVARSGIWSITGQLSILMATLIATPFTIRLLGPASYGVWALLLSMLTYFKLADLGMTTASTKLAAERYAAGDTSGEAVVIWTALTVTAALTGAAALVVSVAAPFVVSNLLHVKGHLAGASVLGLRLIAAASVAYAVIGVSNTPQQVRLCWGRLTLATSGPAVLQVAISPIVLVVTAGGVVAMTVIVLAASCAAAIANFLVAARLLPTLRRPRSRSWAARPLVKYGAWLAVSGFAGVPLTTAERFFLAHYHSSTQVAYYAVAASLGALLTIIPAAVSQPMLPALTRLSSEGRHGDHRRLYHQVLRGIFLLTTPAALTLAFVARPFLGLWAGHTYSVHSVTAFDVIVAGVWLNTLAVTPYYQLLASGRTATVALIHVAELIPYLIIAAVLASAFGVIGAAIAWSLRIAVDAVLFFFIPTRTQRLPWKLTPHRTGGAIFVIAGFAGCLWGFSQLTGSLPARVGLSVLAITGYGLALWGLVLTSGERATIAELAKAILPGKPAPL